MRYNFVLPASIALLSLTSWPLVFTLSKYNLMKDQLTIFITGIIVLLLATVAPYFLFRRYVKKADPVIYAFSLFCWTCVIDLGIGLELNGYFSNFMAFYFAEGEPYLKSGHGAAINLWDGTVHFGLYLAIICLYSSRASHREIALYWVGSMMNSMVVLLQGAVGGHHPFKMSILLNIPFFVIPLFVAIKLLHESPPQARTFLKFDALWKRPIDFAFVLYFIAAIVVAVFRGMAVLGGNAELLKKYTIVYEPYLADPTNFPKFQILTYEYFFLAYYLFAIYGLVCPGQHWMANWSLIHAGAAAHAQVTYIYGSCHPLTAKSLRPPLPGTSALVFWGINLALLIIPQLFAWRCLSNIEEFGRTYTVERADLVENSAQGKKCVKITKDD